MSPADAVAPPPSPALAPPVANVPVPLWTCEFFPLKEEGASGPALDALTVGAKFGWKCHGDLAVDWPTPGAPTLVFQKPEDEHSLAILKVIRQDPNDVQYVVTAYKAGDHKPEWLRVMQGRDKGFEAGKPAWSVKSVLDPKQPPQPFGPLGPWSLSLPLWFTICVLVFLALVVFMIVRRVRRHLQRRRMLEELQRHKTALPPLHQFYRDARQLRRRMNNFKDPVELKVISEDLNREFRLYVLRQFQIPALDWSDRAILDDLRKRHRKTYRLAAEPLKKTLRELVKLKARANVGLQDVEQMHRMSLDAAERLESLRAGGRA